MGKWRTIGVSILKESELSGGKELLEITKKYFNWVMKSKDKKLIKKIITDPDFAKWNEVL